MLYTFLLDQFVHLFFFYFGEFVATPSSRFYWSDARTVLYVSEPL